MALKRRDSSVRGQLLFDKFREAKVPPLTEVEIVIVKDR